MMMTMTVPLVRAIIMMVVTMTEGMAVTGAVTGAGVIDLAELHQK